MLRAGLMVPVALLLLGGCGVPNPIVQPTSLLPPTATTANSATLSSATLIAAAGATSTLQPATTVTPILSPLTTTTLIATASATSTLRPVATALLAATPTVPLSQPPTPAQVKNCGQIEMLGANPPSDPTALQAENCFWLHFQQCRAAVLIVAVRVASGGTNHQFMISLQDSACQISDRVYTNTFPPGAGRIYNYTCASVTRNEGGLLFLTCGTEGDFFVPPPRTP